jgi:hypothetical protein
MLQRIETFELPDRVRTILDRGVLAIGVAAFASGLVGLFLG